jgi:hypothetical protein
MLVQLPAVPQPPLLAVPGIQSVRAAHCPVNTPVFVVSQSDVAVGVCTTVHLPTLRLHGKFCAVVLTDTPLDSDVTMGLFEESTRLIFNALVCADKRILSAFESAKFQVV